MLPETMIQTYRNKIPRQWKICFFVALLAGFSAHFYKITNWLPNWDSLVFRYDAQNMLDLGRWFLPVVCSFSSFYDLPWLNGCLAILFHGLGAVCICCMFRVKKGVTAGLLGAVIVSFPTVTSVLMYNYVADGYAIAFFLACLAAVWLTEEKPRFFGAVVCIMLSVAIYQAYLTVTVKLLLIYLIRKLLFENASIKTLFQKSVRFLLAGGLSMGLYYLILTLLLKLTGTSLLEYQGMDSAFSLTNLNIVDAILQSFYMFRHYFFDFEHDVKIFAVLNCAIAVFGIAGYAVAFFRNRVYRSVGKCAFLLVLAVCLPFGANLLVFVNPGVDYHNLMKMGYCMIYVLFLLLYEAVPVSDFRYRAGNAWAVLVLGCCLVGNQTVLANVGYHKAQMAYEKSYGTLLRIADRIEQLDGSEACEELLVIGALPTSEAYSASLPPDITGITDGYIIRHDDEIVGQSVFTAALNDYCGKDYQFLAGTRKQEFLKTEAIQNMPCWPEQGCVAVTDGVIVVKLGVEVEK